jgi:hypothetical protein
VETTSSDNRRRFNELAPEVARHQKLENALRPNSTPAASTTYLVLRQGLAVCAVSRLQHVSKPVYGFGLVKQPNGAFDRRGTEMHIPLGRDEIHVSGELLNCPRRRPSHRQVRTERRCASGRDRIRHGPRGTKVKGRVVRISATSIDLLVNDGSRKWTASEVAFITQRRGHAGRGALIGLAVGFGLGAIVVLTDSDCQNYHYEGCGREDAQWALFLGALLGGIGGGAGAAIGAAIRPERVLYAAPSPSAHVFSLRVAPGVIGLRAQLRF